MSRTRGSAGSWSGVIVPAGGGAFGQKRCQRPEELGVAFATHRLGRPVKWIEDRRENLLCGEHAREDHASVSFAVNEHGTILGAKADFLESAGSFPVAASSALLFSAPLFPGPYRIPAYAGAGRTVYTNTAGRGSYRGPWMIETVAREQTIDRVASWLGIDPLELRRRNVIRERDLPYTMASGLVYDQMTAAATLDQAAEIIGYDQLREQQSVWREEGRLVGIGISLLAEPSAMAFGWFATEAASVRIGLNGHADVVTSSASHGQSHETTIAHAAADEVGIDADHLRVLHADTATTPLGPGTGGGRSAVALGGAARDAGQQVRAQIMSIASHQLEAAPEDLEIVKGLVRVVGAPTHGTTVADVAHTAYLDVAGLPPRPAPPPAAQPRSTPPSPIPSAHPCHI